MVFEEAIRNVFFSYEIGKIGSPSTYSQSASRFFCSPCKKLPARSAIRASRAALGISCVLKFSNLLCEKNLSNSFLEYHRLTFALSTIYPLLFLIPATFCSRWRKMKKGQGDEKILTQTVLLRTARRDF